MSENNTTVTTPDGTVTTKQERTFTQEEVNAMVNKRYAEWASKTADYDELKAKAAKYDEMEEANKSELQKEKERADKLQKDLDALNKANNIQAMRSKVAEEMKIPANLLTAEDEEACREQAKNILAFAQPPGGNTVQDGGEVTVTGGKKTTREMFADTFNEAIGMKK